MKKLIFLIMIFFACSCSTTKTLPFAPSKKSHKTVKKMSKRQRIKNHNRNIDSNCNKIYRIKL